MNRPIARPIAQRLALEKGWVDGLSQPNSAAEDSRASRSCYLTRPRLDAIAGAMVERDWQVLNFVSDVRLATGKQLVRTFWGTEEHSAAAARAGRRALRRLATWRVLDPVPGRAVGGARGGSGGIVYGVGIAGSKLLARRGLRVRTLGAPGDRHVAHTLAIAEVVVGLHEAEHRGELDLIEIQTEPSCWRPYLGPMGARLIVKPDLFVRLGSGAFEESWLLEIDLATESRATIEAKARRYFAHYRSGVEQAEHGVYPRVLWAVPTLARFHQVSDALRRLPGEAWKLFAICPLAEVVERLAAEARS